MISNQYPEINNQHPASGIRQQAMIMRRALKKMAIIVGYVRKNDFSLTQIP